MAKVFFIGKSSTTVSYDYPMKKSDKLEMYVIIFYIKLPIASGFRSR